MFGSEVLDVAIGLFVTYLILSTVCSGINEFIAGIFAKRANTLEEWLRRAFQDPTGENLTKKFLAHPLISALAAKARPPSYIPSHLFAVALMDLLIPSDGERPTLKKLRNALVVQAEKDTEGIAELKKALLPLIDNAEQDLGKARESIEKWFDNAMVRVSGWYKRGQQRNILIIAVVLVVFLNADTIMIGNLLTQSQTLREAAVEVAKQRTAQALDQPAPAPGPPATTVPSSIEQIRSDLGDLQFQLGWTNVPWAALIGGTAAPTARASGPPPFGDFPRDVGSGLMKAVGLFITVAAVSLGAPFWFDLLNKLVNLRSSGGPPKPTAESGPPQTETQLVALVPSGR